MVVGRLFQLLLIQLFFYRWWQSWKR